MFIYIKVTPRNFITCISLKVEHLKHFVNTYMNANDMYLFIYWLCASLVFMHQLILQENITFLSNEFFNSKYTKLDSFNFLNCMVKGIVFSVDLYGDKQENKWLYVYVNTYICRHVTPDPQKRSFRNDKKNGYCMYIKQLVFAISWSAKLNPI